MNLNQQAILSLLKEAYNLGRSDESFDTLNALPEDELLENTEPNPIELLKSLFQFSMETHAWGRFLFYLIKGNSKIELDTLKQHNLTLSPMPRLLHPMQCIAPSCINDSPLHEFDEYQEFYKWVKDGRPTNFYHEKCRGIWVERAMQPLKKAIELAYDCFPAKNTETEVNDLIKGYRVLTEYLIGRQYQPAAFLIPAFKTNITLEVLSRVCLMPSEFVGGIDHFASFRPFNELSLVNKWHKPTDVPIYIPIEPFNTKAITSDLTGRYKRITVFLDDLMASDEEGNINEIQLLRLKDLGKFLT